MATPHVQPGTGRGSWGVTRTRNAAFPGGDYPARAQTDLRDTGPPIAEIAGFTVTST